MKCDRCDKDTQGSRRRICHCCGRKCCSRCAHSWGNGDSRTERCTDCDKFHHEGPRGGKGGGDRCWTGECPHRKEG